MAGRKWMWLIAVTLFVIALLYLFNADIKRTELWVDSLTATCRIETSWFGGVFITDQRIVVSGFETWERDHGLFKGYSWQCTNAIHKNIFNHSLILACGRSPAIAGFRGHPSTLIVKYSTDEEIKTFLNIVATGTDEQIEKAIYWASDVINERVPESEWKEEDLVIR